LLRELAEHPDVVKVELHTNYRSGRQIVAAAEYALGVHRDFKAHSKLEGLVKFTHCPNGLDAQVEHVVNDLVPAMTANDEPYGQVAIVYPTQQEGDALEKGFLATDIPYVRLDRGAGYRRTPLTRLVEDLACWCCGGWREGRPALTALLVKWRAILAGLDDLDQRTARKALVRFLFATRDPSGPCGPWLGRLDQEVFRVIKRALDEDEREAFDELVAVCAEDGDLSKLDVGMFAGKSGSPHHVVLMNLHTSKGTEFNNVILVGMDSGRMPIYRAQSADKIAEQRRLFFVGVSRARHALHSLYSGWTMNRFGRRFNDGPSPFVVELQARLGAATA
jgi:DNA helicase II / ATP-dependent DNA helicase PcrA